MKVAVPKERRPDEARVAATPETVKRIAGMGAEVVVEAGAGSGAKIADSEYEAAGATIAPDAEAALKDADVVLKVARPLSAGEGGGPDEMGLFKRGAALIGMLAPHAARDQVKAYAERGIDAFALELLPRITRGQAMDVLSSQANLAGYRAMIEAARHYARVFPMMMTAAGSVAPARVFVMGAGVAGLQAIATARRLGSIVSATDVRPAAKEEVESLGATFVGVPLEEAATAGGYAKELTEEQRNRQAEMVREHLPKQDIVVTTALIPGRPAPKLVTADMVRSMRPGSVIVDLAGEAGGNCELTEYGETVEREGVTIVSPANLPSAMAPASSALYAKNLMNFLALLVDQETKQLRIDEEDELVQGTLLTRDGKVVHRNFVEGT
jgi:H+-translocating NAD(P) transhydrogenase subunit alpha